MSWNNIIPAEMLMDLLKKYKITLVAKTKERKDIRHHQGIITPKHTVKKEKDEQVRKDIKNTDPQIHSTD